MGKVITFVSLKGGVGKTTISLETASSLVNDYGKSVLLVDANFSAPNLHMHLDFDPETTLHDVLRGKDQVHSAIYEVHGIDILPASIDFRDEIDPYKLKRHLQKFKERYDFIILDSSPHKSEMLPAIAAADKVFIVTTPDEVTLLTSVRAAHLAKQDKIPIDGILINRVKNSAYEKTLDEIEEASSLPVLARVLDHKKILEANFFKTPITVHDPSNKISREIKKFAGILAGTPEEKGLLENFLGLNFGKEKVNREVFRQKLYESRFT